MPPELPPDSDYASSEDSDFEAFDDAASSSSEADEPALQEDAKSASKKKRKRNVGTEGEEAEDAGIENSGDEAIIERGKKKRRKGKRTDEDEGGEGGVVKTRSMRAAAKEESKKILVDASKATVDVEKLWADMMAGKAAPAPAPATEPEPEKAADKGKLPEKEEEQEMITIKRTYNFAGKLHTEQKLVPRNSAEAKLYLASQPDPSKLPEAAENSPLPQKRRLKLARRSAFEPISDLPPRSDLAFSLRKASGEGIINGVGKEKKLNTVEKSAMDWAGFVDKEGIADELDAAGKSKGAYRARQEFLARVEGKKEEEGRRARGIV